MTSALVPRFLAELAGTALLVAIGTGTIVASARIGGVPSWVLVVGWFVAVLAPIVLFVGVSGAHLNPAVTLGLALSGRVAWTEVPAYFLGQFSGAFLGTAFVAAFVGTGDHLGSTLPLTSLTTVFAGEASFTAGLVAAVFLLSDRGAGRLRWRLTLPPAVVGTSTYVIGPLSGSSLNPARSIAPAVVSGSFLDLWVYVLATLVGAVAVALLWKPTSVDRLDRGPGRFEVDR